MVAEDVLSSLHPSLAHHKCSSCAPTSTEPDGTCSSPVPIHLQKDPSTDCDSKAKQCSSIIPEWDFPICQCPEFCLEQC